jgi:hypothetical protein
MKWASQRAAPWAGEDKAGMEITIKKRGIRIFRKRTIHPQSSEET